MSENYVPHLTLNPDGAAAQAAPAAPAAPTAPAASATAAASAVAPTLTVGNKTSQNSASASEPVVIDESMLTEEERRAVDAFVEQIDITDATQVMQYGSAAQQNIAQFSESTLSNVRTKDLGAVGEALSNLVLELKQVGQPEKKKSGPFQKGKRRVEEVRTQYAKVEDNVDKISEMLESHQVELMKDVAMLDQMFDLNQQYAKELTMYIVAGKKKLAAVRESELPALKQKAEQSGTQEDAQAYNDLVSMCNRFDKKINDLELTRTISIQMGPQTRMLQNNDTLMIEKIQTSLVNTIPLWKSQMVLALGLEHTRQATEAQRAVTDMTNDLLRQNAELLHTGTVSAAQEAERSIVDLETLQQTNQELIATLDEVVRIQDEGRTKRAEAEAELGRIEGELKQKLMEMH